MMAGLDIWDCDCYCLAGKEDCLLGRLLAGDCVHMLAPDEGIKAAGPVIRTVTKFLRKYLLY